MLTIDDLHTTVWKHLVAGQIVMSKMVLDSAAQDIAQARPWSSFIGVSSYCTNILMYIPAKAVPTNMYRCVIYMFVIVARCVS